MLLPRRSILVALAAMLVAAAMPLATLIRAPLSPDLLWLAAPYAALAAALVIPWGEADRRTRSGCVVALVLLAVTHYFYRGAGDSHSSTAGMFRVFLSMYLLAGSALLWALLYWLGPRIWAWLSAETGKLD